jgi:integrase
LPSIRTEKAYRRAAERFNAELAKCALEPTPENYVVVATADEPYLTDASWRFIRAALKWWIAQTQGVQKADYFTELFRDKKPPVKPKLRLMKGMSTQLQLDLIMILRNGHKGRYKLLAADMIEAGVATGLRPVEWKDASVVDDVLRVPNAKFRPGISGNGEVRDLILIDDVITPGERAAIDRVILALNGVEWDEIGGHVRRALIAAKSKLRKMSLITTKETRTRMYDTRHQFAADAKNNLNYEGGEVAAAMGHKSAITAHSSYGKKRRGRVGLSVKPSAANVATVDQESVMKLAASISKAGLKPGPTTVDRPVQEPILHATSPKQGPPMERPHIPSKMPGPD